MCSIYILAHNLHTLLEYVDYSWNYFFQQIFLGFVDQILFSNFCDFFPSQKPMLVYSFESLSLKAMQGNGVVYLTVLAPHNAYLGPYIIPLCGWFSVNGAWSTVLMEVNRFYGWRIIWQGCTGICNSEKVFHAEKCYGSWLTTYN